jgi:hypothetical protein
MSSERRCPPTPRWLPPQLPDKLNSPNLRYHKFIAFQRGAARCISPEQHLSEKIILTSAFILVENPHRNTWDVNPSIELKRRVAGDNCLLP